MGTGPLSAGVVGVGRHFGLRQSHHLAGQIKALAEEHVVLAQAAARPVQEVVDFLDERGQKRAELFRAIRQEGDQCGLRGNPGLEGGFPHQILALDPLFRAAADLLLHPVCEREEAFGVMAEHELLLLLEEVEQAPVFLEFVLQRGDDLLEKVIHDGLESEGFWARCGESEAKRIEEKLEGRPLTELAMVSLTKYW